jgi:hypothetical protein
MVSESERAALGMSLEHLIDAVIQATCAERIRAAPRASDGEGDPPCAAAIRR